MASTVFGPIDQIGYVVSDLDAAVASRTAAMGLGPWTIFRASTLVGQYQGQPATVTIDVALAYQEGVQIELIQQRSDGPSPYLGAQGPKVGVHHVAWLVDDLDAAITAAAARGLNVAFRGSNAAVRVVYLEMSDEPDIFYELIQGEGMRAMIDAGIAKASSWDGRDPVEEIDMSGTGAA